MTTVKWFYVSANLSNQQIVECLDPSLQIEPGTGRDLKLFKRGKQGVACRTSPDLLKIYISDLVPAARKCFGIEAGES